MSITEPTPIMLSGRARVPDPYPLYANLRAECPVQHVQFPSGVKAWLVVGYDAAHDALLDPRLGKSHSRGNDEWRASASIMPEPLHSQLQVHLLHQDAPRHTVMRDLIGDAFAPRRVDAMRPRFQAIADELIDALPPNGEVDLIAGFAAPFPFRVLAEVIGLPPRLTTEFRREWGKVVAPVGPLDSGRPAYEALVRELQIYIAQVVATPGDGLLRTLVDAHTDGTLTRAECDSMIFQLLAAGQEPVTNQIGTAMLSLYRHPAQLRRLYDEPALLDRGLEELMRYDGAFQLTTWRFFAQDSKLHGVDIPAGDSVIVALGAANRDPARFRDADSLDLRRTPNPHLSFGLGSHFCPGAALARVELQVALSTLLRRLRGFRLAVPENDLTWNAAVLSPGVLRLPLIADA